MKFIGFIMVFLGCTTAGFVKSYEYINSQNELYAMIQLVRFIKREVGVYLTRQQEIFERFENETLEKNGFLNSLRKERIVDDKSTLYHTLKKYEKKMGICREGMGIMIEFSESFGRISRFEQNEKCDAALTVLEEIYAKEKEENVTRVKLCRSIGCVAGIALILLFI